MAKHNDAFQGSSDILFTSNNGKFLRLIEMLGKLDLVIIEHIRWIKYNGMHVHYLGPKIQCNLIESMTEEVKKEIITKIKSAKYFAIIMDCAPDVSYMKNSFPLSLGL